MLIDKLDEGIVLLYWDGWKAHHPRKSHYVTELSMPQGKGKPPLGRCIREQWYNWMEIKPTDLDPTRILFKMVGGILHDHLFKACWERAGVQLDDEVPIEVKKRNLKYPIHGKMDYQMELQGPRVVEVKTTQGRGITNKAFGIKYNGPKIEHQLQLAWYYDHCGMEVEADFVYFGRDNFYRMDFPWEDVENHPWKNKWPKAYARWRDLETFVEQKLIPPMDFDGENYPCSWCEWQSRCAKDHKDELKKVANI